jgi:proteasome lid subunit RPN8/RPN11
MLLTVLEKLKQVKIKEQLSEYYSTEPSERIGFVMPDGSIIETINISMNPANTFHFRSVDVFNYVFKEGAVATWHTHPNMSSDMSEDDYQMFLNYPDMVHYVIGSDGVNAFIVEDGVVLHA